MFDVQSYLDLPENPLNCIYENYRNKILVNYHSLINLLKYNHKEEIQNIHALHIALYDKYGENWVDHISFSDEKLREAIKLLYIKEYPGKDMIVTKQKERRELYKNSPISRRGD